MNLAEFCEQFRISHKKARQMEKAGVLRLDENLRTAVLAIRENLSRGQALTAAQLVELVDNPGALLDLGKYASRAQDELAAIGDAKAQAAPKSVAIQITDAAKGDPDAVLYLVQWLCEIIPSEPVGHNYVAARLLLGLAPNVRQYDIPRIPRALLNCRRHPDFAGWWRVEARGKRNVTIYCKPENSLASFDL